MLGRTSAKILDFWRHTDGGPARNFLAGWTPAAIVLSVDLGLVNRGGPVLAVLADTTVGDERIDRMGRPLTGNGLLAHLGSDEEAEPYRLAYNAATPGTAEVFVPVIARSLALYDGYDGHCGNQLMVDQAAPPAQRYLPLAKLLADDRLWVDSTARTVHSCSPWSWLRCRRRALPPRLRRPHPALRRRERLPLAARQRRPDRDHRRRRSR